MHCKHYHCWVVFVTLKIVVKKNHWTDGHVIPLPPMSSVFAQNAGHLSNIMSANTSELVWKLNCQVASLSFSHRSVLEVSSALCTWHAHFRGRVHLVRTCSPYVHIFLPIYHSYIQEECIEKSMGIQVQMVGECALTR